MDDNILIEGTTEPGTSTDFIAVEDLNKMDAIHIIDFSDLSIGEQPANFVHNNKAWLLSCLYAYFKNKVIVHH